MLGKFNGINTCRIFVLFWCISLCTWLGFIPQTVADAANVQSYQTITDSSRRENIFANPVINRLIDENYREVQEKGYAELRIPLSLHKITKERISPNAVDAADKLIRAGYQVYLVGGSVRDLVLGEAPKDFDLTTNASFDEQATVFKEQMSSHGHPNGITYGKVIYKEGNKEEDIDLSTMRNIPEYYHGTEGIPQSSVKGLYSASPLFDAFQRDLKMNALYYDMATGELVDFTGGLHDLREHILDTVAPPEVQLPNDTTTAMRALRFKIRYGFSLSYRLDKNIREHGKEYVKKLSAPQTYVLFQFNKMFTAGKAVKCAETLRDYDLYTSIFPGIANVANTESYQREVNRLLDALDKQYAKGLKIPEWRPLVTILYPVAKKSSYEEIENILAKQAQAAPLRSKEMAAARAELHYLRELQP